MSDFCLVYFELSTGRKAYVNPNCVSALIEDPKDGVVNICIVGEEGTVLPVRSDIKTVANELRKASALAGYYSVT